MQYLQYALDHWDKIALYGFAALGVAETVVKITPTQTDNKILGYVRVVFKFLSDRVPDIQKITKKK